MKKYKLFAMGLAMAGAMSFTSCADDYLDTAPTDAVSNVTIGQNMESLYLGLNGIHRQMISQESGYQCMGGLGGMMYIMDIMADDITWLTNTWMKAAYLGWQCNTNDQNGYNTVFWRLYYQWIMNANGLLEVLDGTDVSALSGGDKALYEQIRGEALVFRAFSHFQAVQTYADAYKAGGNNSQPGVPYRTVENKVDQELARSTVEETYAKINADLAEACSLLEGKNITELNHWSAKSAYAVRARVAMAMQDYTNAAAYAEKSIQLAEAEGGKLMDASNLMHGFADITTKTNEAMYAAMTQDDQTIYFYSFYAFMSWNFSATAIRQGVKAINADTYDAMSETDLRRQWWDPTGEMDVPLSSFKKTKYQNRKFTARDVSNAVGDVAFIRLSEMYLTLAEAYARGGNTAKAQEVFTKFQITRDPAYAPSGNLIDEIMHSRRIELWAEGLRYFDLKRLNLPLKRGRNFDVTFCTFLEKAPGEKGWTWEIPKIETDNNPLCEKNY